jgi:hypothetical protein
VPGKSDWRSPPVQTSYAPARAGAICSEADLTVASSIQEMRKASLAFRQALLRSEKKRVVAAILFLSIFEVLMLIRIFLLGSAMSRWGVLTVLSLIAFEIGLLRTVNRVLSSGADISQAVWYLSVTLESLCPAVGIAFLTSSRLPQDYRPLATPWALAFFPFILLSVLRLSPRLCWVSGIVSTIGYLGAAHFTGFRFTPGSSGFSVTQTATLYFAFLLATTGIIASVVANEIRIHVDVALREAETRHQLQQVEHELQIARSIQQSLLPKIRPQIVGFQVSGWNRSADDTGGDFYDWKRLPDGRRVIVLADVAGHGIGPAFWLPYAARTPVQVSTPATACQWPSGTLITPLSQIRPRSVSLLLSVLCSRKAATWWNYFPQAMGLLLYTKRKPRPFAACRHKLCHWGSCGRWMAQSP